MIVNGYREQDIKLLGILPNFLRYVLQNTKVNIRKN